MPSSFQHLVVGVTELLNRSAEHVIDHHQPRIWRDDDALRGQRSVSDARHLVVQRRHGGHELPNQTERSIDFKRQKLLFRHREHGGQPRSWHAIRDDDKP